MAGTLYVVATPLGNLEDITLRGLRILREVDFIACEDTRTSSKLLHHFEISKPLIAYHEHNESARGSELASRIAAGENGALISDAGTPLISDPGYRLVRACLDVGVTVVPIPGANAAMAALSVSGLGTDAMTFVGFLPAKESQRKKRLEELRKAEGTLVFYEAPHRIVEVLRDVAEVYGDPQVVVAREMTKLHEEFLRGTASEVAGRMERNTVRGEITVLVGDREVGVNVDTPVGERVQELMGSGLGEMEAIKAVAKERGLGKREIYAILKGKG